MTTEDTKIIQDSDNLKQNLSKLEELTQRFVQVVNNKRHVNPALNGPGPDLVVKASAAYWQAMLDNPSKLMEQQIAYWGQTLSHFVEAQKAMSAENFALNDVEPSKDRRFSNPQWTSNPYFRLIRQQYETNVETIRKSVSEIEGLPTKDRQRLEYFTDQITDMMAPTNFFGTNPDALERAVETEGQSLITGLENLIADLEANGGELIVKLADETAFEVGGNIATTKGKVVFRNDLMELIQYSPTTDEVYETPLVIFPPWINKFYILDLKEQNSLIKWITDQGYTLFVVSWVNPDSSHAEVGLEDYIEQGYLKAFDVAKEITDQPQVNAIGYCIAGTTLSLTLSLLKKRGDTTIKSATFFTALTDFSDQGEFTPFLQNDFIDGIEEQVAQTGMLESFIMARTFSYLRSNDLIYRPAIKSYMMGEAPPAFDLLYWNGDGANLPAKMVVEYLRGLCQRNEFATDGFELFGETLHLRDVDVPLCSVACETDHIAAWKDCYRGVQQMGSEDKMFILSQSGHIAGIVNPPSKDKYGHYTNEDLSLINEDWFASATFQKGSWWPRWENWLRPLSGAKVPARSPGDSGYEVLMDAPGSYVLRRAND